MSDTLDLLRQQVASLSNAQDYEIKVYMGNISVSYTHLTLPTNREV